MMYKKITAICLVFILVVTTAVIPVFAGTNQNSITIGSQNVNGISISKTLLASNGKNNDKKDNKDLEKALKKFLDSDEFEWAEKAIEKMGAKGIINGIGNGYYKPKNNVTHAEAIAMVLKLAGYQKQAEAIKTQPLFFKGAAAQWSFGYLQLAIEKGIIVPNEDEWFNPNEPAKRHDVAKYIVRALGLREEALDHMKDKLNFKDAAAIPKNSVGYVYVITELEIMKGFNNEFQPNKPITRAEMAVLLERAENNVDPEESGSSLTIEGTFVSYDSDDERLTMKIDNKTVTYDVNPKAPVYKNSKYYGITELESGNIISIILDSEKKIIFIEVLGQSTTPAGEKLSIRNMDYEDLPEELQDIIDKQKLTQGYTAYIVEDDIYLIASRGKKSTGGYTINIEEVYKETISTGKYNLKAVVEIENPDGPVTQATTYPYDVVKLSYFNGIQKVKFVNDSDAVLAQTTVKSIDEAVVITGKIDSIDVSDREVKLLEKDGKVRTYEIPTEAQILLDNKTSRLSALEEGMTASITKTNGVITKLAAESEDDIELSIRNVKYEDLPEALQDKVDEQKLTQAYKAYKYEDDIYLIATRGRKSTGGYTINIDDVYKVIVEKDEYNVKAVIETANPSGTATQGITYPYDIVKLDYFDDIEKVYFVDKTDKVLEQTTIKTIDATEVINGKIDSVDAGDRIVKLLESDGRVRSYSIPSNVVITLDNKTVRLTALSKNMPAAITRTNGVITKLAAQSEAQVIETINGKIDSVNTTDRVIKIIEKDNIVRSYYIPSNVTITLNNRSASLSSLEEGMTAELTRTNSVITKLAVTNVVETINGTIDSVDVARNVIKILERDHVVRSYSFPEDIEITLDNEDAELADLAKGMKAVVTKTNGEITKIAVQRDIQTVEGILITTYTNQSKTYVSVKVGTTIRSYELTNDTKVLYNNQSSTIQNIPLNSTIIIKVENGTVIEVKNK